MKSTITRDEAVAIWKEYITKPHLKLHMRESEVIMRKLAVHFGADPEQWGITGLLHDLDMEKVEDDYSKHGYETVNILKSKGYDIPEMFDAIVAHAEGVNDAKRTTKLDYILAASESVTGIISAYVMILPNKNLSGANVKSIKKRMKQARFAAAVNRDFIRDIEKADLDLDTFLQLAIEAMQEISDELGM